MRIAFVVGQFPALSVTFIMNQITGLLDRGHEVDVYALQPDERVVHEDAIRYQLARRTRYAPSHDASGFGRVRWAAAACRGLLTARPSVARVVRLLRRYGPPSLTIWPYASLAAQRSRRYDVIHAHFGPKGVKAAAMRDAGLLIGPLVTAFHGFDMAKYTGTRGRRMYAPLFERGDLFLPISERWKARLLEWGCDPSRVFVHRMGIDPDRFVFRPRTLAPGEPFRVLTVARLVEKKGVEYGIRAIARVRRAHAVEYTVVGDGPLCATLRSLIARLGVGDTVRLVGWKSQDDVATLMQQANLLLAPSVRAADGDEEGIPVVLMEAMATGAPVVSTTHSGIPELVEDGVAGYLVPERDVEALADRIHLLAGHPERWCEMGRAGRERVQREYNVHHLNDRLVELYERCAASYSAQRGYAGELAHDAAPHFPAGSAPPPSR